MAQGLLTFWTEESAQDMVEYTLLIALVALATAAIFSNSTQYMGGIWQREGQTLNTANTFAAS